MKFSKIVDAVQAKVNRPDLLRETRLAIAEAILYFHSIELWNEDIVSETNIGEVVDGRLVIHKDDLEFKFKRFVPKSRGIGKQGYAVQVKGCKPLCELPATKCLCPSSIGFFSTANQIIIRAPFRIKCKKDVTICYIAFPKVEDCEHNSWIANNYPHFVINRACEQLHHDLGDIGRFKLASTTRQKHEELILRNHTAL